MVQVSSPKGAKAKAKPTAVVPFIKREKNGKPKVQRVKNAKGAYVFAKGNSGGGRPLGSKTNTLTNILREVLDTYQFNTKSGDKINGARALVEAMLVRAVTKSDGMATEIFNRIDGKVTEKSDDESEVQQIKITVHHKKG